MPGLKKQVEDPPRRKRGRPKKSESSAEPGTEALQPVKKKRGRPRKSEPPAAPQLELIVEEKVELTLTPEPEPAPVPEEAGQEPEMEAAMSELTLEEQEETTPESETEPELTVLSEEEPPALEEEPAPEPEPISAGGDITLQYDMDSQERYVDSTSQKTEFERVLDDLAVISKDMLSWEVEKFTRKYQGEGDEAESTARKFEAFLGGFITNAAMELYDRGYAEAALQRLEQAQKVLEARRKLESEVESIKARQEEDKVDLSDLGLFDDDGE